MVEKHAIETGGGLLDEFSYDQEKSDVLVVAADGAVGLGTGLVTTRRTALAVTISSSIESWKTGFWSFVYEDIPSSVL